MRRFRLSTLMLLIVIAALGIALVMHQQRATRREDELRHEMARREGEFNWRMEAIEIEHHLGAHEEEAASRDSAVESRVVRKGDQQ